MGDAFSDSARIERAERKARQAASNFLGSLRTFLEAGGLVSRRAAVAAYATYDGVDVNDTPGMSRLNRNLTQLRRGSQKEWANLLRRAMSDTSAVSGFYAGLLKLSPFKDCDTFLVGDHALLRSGQLVVTGKGTALLEALARTGAFIGQPSAGKGNTFVAVPAAPAESQQPLPETEPRVLQVVHVPLTLDVRLKSVALQSRMTYNDLLLDILDKELTKQGY